MSFGLIGENLSHSYSKIVHQLFGSYRYNLFPLAPSELEDFVKKRNFFGLNVTAPYKERVLPLCDVLDPIAIEVGAVNTLYFQGDVLHGTNTDYLGFLYMVKKSGLSFCKKKVAVLGSGGASAMVQAALRDLGASSIYVASRTPLVSTGISTSVSYKNIPKDVEIIINTTPLGTHPNFSDCPVELKNFPQCQGVLDLIYNPPKSALLLNAEDLSIPFANGLSMLVAQALASSKFFTSSQKPLPISPKHLSFFSSRDLKQIDTIVNTLHSKSSNIVLIGMPGSGKTSIGQALADKLSLPFVDTDIMLEKIDGRTPKTIIECDGEEFFRNLEKKLIRNLTSTSGAVIATGGGSVLDSDNVYNLRHRGLIIWIKRDLPHLATSNRPLSKDEKSLATLFAKREPTYSKVCHYSIDNSSSINHGVSSILSCLSSHSFLVKE